MNVAVVDPAATVTDAGTVNEALLSDSVTVPPPVFDNVTVHVLLAPDSKDPGVQLRLVGVGGLGRVEVIPPPVPVKERVDPSNPDATAPETPIDVAVTPDANVTLTSATMPSGMRLALGPDKIHA